MKKILVISDNENLIKHIQGVVSKKTMADVAIFDMYYSYSNKSPQGLIDLGLDSINVKDDEACDWIVNTYDMVLSLHCKQIFPEKLTSSICCINFHPGFNPYNRGWYPQVFSIINKLPVGVTVHEMDEQIDHGSIICQEKVSIEVYETSKDVYDKVIELEKKIISEKLFDIVTNNYSANRMGEFGNYNSVEDFRKICQLDLDDVAPLRVHLELLKALSHGNFKNAYFIDEQKKIFVSLNMFPED